MTVRSFGLLAGLSVCCACNGVGRALIDYQPPSVTETLLCSSMRCQGVLPELVVPDTPAEYGDLSSCSESVAMEQGRLPLDGCRCRILELDLPSESALPVTLSAPGSFESCRLQMRSERPIEVQWVAARVENVHIELEGPITLSLRAASVSRVSLGASSEQATLSFERSQVALFTLHGTERPLPNLVAERTTFANALLETDHARFKSVGLRASTLTARSLDADDLTAQHARLRVDETLVSSSRMDVVELPTCVELSILGSQLSTVEATCRERIDLFSTRAQNSVFDGPVECDQAELVEATFGLGEATSLLAFASSFVNTSLCEHVSGARFQGGFGSCIDCEGPLATGEAFLCGEPTFATDGSENPCPAVASIQPCVSFPDRSRPQ